MNHVVRLILLSFLLFALTSSVKAYGEPTFAGSSTNPPGCGNTAPKSVWPFTAKAAGKSSVELTWGKMDNVSSWTVAYGTASRKYIYGISNFGNGEWRTLTVTGLPVGTYYFVIRGNNGCMPGPFSLEWQVPVGGGTARLTSTGKTLGGYTPGSTLVPPGYTSPRKMQTITPTIKPKKPGAVVPAPVPQKTSWWQSILRFFSGKK